jgi:hypothetical protein
MTQNLIKKFQNFFLFKDYKRLFFIYLFYFCLNKKIDLSIIYYYFFFFIIFNLKYLIK